MIEVAHTEAATVPDRSNLVPFWSVPEICEICLRDLAHGARALSRATIMQRKSGQPVPFELTERPREATTVWIARAGLTLQVIEPLPEPQQRFQTPVDAAAGSYRGDWYVVGSRHSV